MDVMDWVILASTGVLVVFFASVAVSEWIARVQRSDERVAARVIQHRVSDTRASAA